MRALALVVASVLAAGSAVAAGPERPRAATPGDEVVRALAATGKAGNRAFEWVRRLTDEVGPRLSGSPGDRAAVAWGLTLLRSLGFEAVAAEPVTVPVWERGVETGEVLEPVRRTLVLTALGGSVSTPVGGLSSEIVEAETLERLDEKVRQDPAWAKGKVVFLSRRMVKGDEKNGYGAVVPIRTEGAIRAAKAGAVGVLIRSVGTDSNRIPHTGMMRYEEGVPRIPAAALAAPDADLLSRLVERGPAVRVRFTLSCRELPDGRTANVVGEVRGREVPDEVVVVGGHLDSWDLGQGAIDDGAGVAMAIEAARLIAAMPRRPARTVRVVLFANEENGLNGGKAYAAAHASEAGRIVAAFEMDAGAGRPTGLAVSAGKGAEELLRPLARLLEPVGAGALTKGGGGADVSPLGRLGVPTLSVTQDERDYFDIHHTANDTLDKVDPVAVQLSAAALAAAVYHVADLPGPLPRAVPGKPRRP